MNATHDCGLNMLESCKQCVASGWLGRFIAWFIPGLGIRGCVVEAVKNINNSHCKPSVFGTKQQVNKLYSDLSNLSWGEIIQTSVHFKVHSTQWIQRQEHKNDSKDTPFARFPNATEPLICKACLAAAGICSPVPKNIPETRINEFTTMQYHIQ